jgi:transposase
VADRLQGRRQVMDKWVTQLQQRQGQDMTVRVAPGPRSGRPPTAPGRIAPLLEAVIDRDPRDWGYRSTVWTAPLLTQYLHAAQALTVSRQSVSRAMARWRLRGKRPRHRLHRRPVTWRQVKGGANGACEDGYGRSSSCLMRPFSPQPHRSRIARGGAAHRAVSR